MIRGQRGFTMITVLWALSLTGAIATGALVAGRSAAGATRNRIEWQRSRWRALGCARRAQSTIDEQLQRTRFAERADLWRRLDTSIVASAALVGCDVTLEPVGNRVDVNTATPEMLGRLLQAAGAASASQIAETIAASRDSASVDDVRQLQSVASVPTVMRFDSLLSIERGRVSLASAPATVLQAIPGFTAEVAQSVVEHREREGPVTELNDVFGLVSRESARELEERFQEIARVATVDPDAWILRSTAASGAPLIAAIVEWRLVREDARVAIARSHVQ